MIEKVLQPIDRCLLIRIIPNVSKVADRETQTKFAMASNYKIKKRNTSLNMKKILRKLRKENHVITLDRL